MQTEHIQNIITQWRRYITHKLTNQRSHVDITMQLKQLNNNQTHINPMITKQSRDIIDKIVHAFSESLVTIYDTNIIESICALIFTSDNLNNIFTDDIKNIIRTYMTNSPCLNTLHQGFIHTLELIREHIITCYLPDTDSIKNTMLSKHINEFIYNTINCWIISCVTLLFCKALFGMNTLEINLPYLFFVAASYSIVDFVIDNNVVNLTLIKNILQLFEQELILSNNQSPKQEFNTSDDDIFVSIKHLIHTYKQHADPNKTKLDAIIYSMATEKDCFKRQRAEDITTDEIITLTINKGLSTGYLILAGLSENTYLKYVNLQNNSQTLQNIFNQYCILLQLLDDLSDYTQDSASGIFTSAKLFSTYPAFAWFVLDCLLDFLNIVQESGIFDKRLNTGFNIVFVNYWCYCCNKNINLIYDTDTELIDLITANYMFDMDYILQIREQKHKKKYELYKQILQNGLNSTEP